MNEEQFERLVKAVQFAIDDKTEAPSMEPRPHWFQNTWATGPVVGSVQVEGVGEMKEVCASGCCLAGNVVATAGAKFVATPSEVLRWSQQRRPGVTGQVEVPWLNQAVMPDGRMNEISDEAEALLGISRVVDCADIGWSCEAAAEQRTEDDVWCHDLFSGDNGIGDILHIASIAAKQYGHELRPRLAGLDKLDLDEVTW